MADQRAELRSLVDERPEMERHLAAIREVDAESDAWGFEDVPLDSGAFGEVVARGVVEETDDGDYRLADPAAVAALLDDGADLLDDEQGDLLPSREWLASVDVDRREVGAVAGALALLALFRIVPYGAVFRRGDVVLSSNDPYFYRSLVAATLGRATGPLDLGVLSRLPAPDGEPLLVALLWWTSEALGGAAAAGAVLAWYPVATAVLSGLAVYLLAGELTDDPRVGLAAVGLLAVTPVHAVRTGVGFADHHALDYLLLAVTALLLVLLARRDRESAGTWLLALALGGAVAGQTLAWEAGPLLAVPVGLYLAVRVLADVADGTAPLAVHAPTVVGLGVAGGLTYAVHAALGWQSTATAVAPVLLFAGALAVVALGEVVHRRGGTVEQLATAEVAAGVVGAVAVAVAVPDLAAELGRGLGVVAGRTGIAESRARGATSLGGLCAPALQFGFVLVLAVPFMAWFALRVARGDDRRWLVPLAYAWVFLPLSVLQVRFAAQLSLFAAVFGGVGFVELAAWVDLAAPTRSLRGAEAAGWAGGDAASSDGGDRAGDDGDGTLVVGDRRRFLRLAGLAAGVGGFGALLTPLQHSQVTIDRAEYEAAAFLREYAGERTDLTNYVLSAWERNRLYNWFVDGEAERYVFARENYVPMLRSRTPGEWYRRLADSVRFVVVDPDDLVDPPDGSVYERLAAGWGDRTGHYRALWTDEEQELRAYELVEGAVVAGRATGAETVSTPVPLDGVAEDYEAPTSVTADGWAARRVPYPGTYGVGDATVTVTDADVRSGGFAGDRSATAHWRLDEDGGRYVFDAVGGNHGLAVDPAWTDGVEGRAFEATGEGYALVAHDDALTPTDGVTVAGWIRAAADQQDASAARLVAKGRGDFEDATGVHLGLDGGAAQAAVGDGGSTRTLGGGDVADGRWHHLALTWDGATARLYVDGEEVDAGTHEGGVATDAPFAIAAAADGSARLVGAVDEVRFRDAAVDAATVASWASASTTGDE
jgi:dolichyl-diphosphooligosaccharide--protein glycosyltransferase